MNAARADALVSAALTATNDETCSEGERAEMLMELAMGLQQRPKSPEQLVAAVTLYDRALAICSADLLRARISARKATALQAIPDEGCAAMEQARAALESALPVRITDAIAAYQQALAGFDRARHPVEYAILQNNLATAFLSITISDERGKMREALAVQCFEDGLKAVNLIDHPSEYAMLQNNLGNALQYASTAHAVENNLRALEAYGEALKVRTRDTAPLEYANTLANRANCLWNLPDDPARPEQGNRVNLAAAKHGYQQAYEIYSEHGERAKCAMVSDAVVQIEREILALAN
jgi:tetratricopeptide (TPR) repeat protein